MLSHVRFIHGRTDDRAYRWIHPGDRVHLEGIHGGHCAEQRVFGFYQAGRFTYEYPPELCSYSDVNHAVLGEVIPKSDEEAEAIKTIESVLKESISNE